MRSTTVIHVVSCHAEGEVGDVIVGGVAPPPGETLWEQSRFIARDETLRNFLLNEPRGGVFRHVNLLVPPKRPGAIAGFIVMEPEDTPPMSGSNSICVATVLLDSDIVPMQEPQTRLTLEAPGGLIEVVADCRRRQGRANQRAETCPRSPTGSTPRSRSKGLGALNVDIAYGGDSFVIVDAREPRLCDPARRGARPRRSRHENHRRGERAIGLRPSRECRTGATSRSASSPAPLVEEDGVLTGRQRGGGAARQDRPLADRHRLLGAHGDAARARAA